MYSVLHAVNRRQYAAQVAGLVALLAGCTGNEDDDISDSAGDGVIDSEDYAPNDPAVQEKSDFQPDSPQQTEQPTTTSTEEPTTREPTTTTTTATERPPTPTPTTTTEIPTTTTLPNSAFPSHSGTHTITAGEDYWSTKISLPVKFELQYSVSNQRAKKYDFDVFVYSEQQYKNYKAKIGGDVLSLPDPISRASLQNVKEGGRRSTILSSGVYYFVIDNTDIGDAGDWGAEADRKVHVELTTKRA